MKQLFFILFTILFFAAGSQAQLLVVHPKYKYKYDYISTSDVPYYFTSVSGEKGAIIINLDNKTIVFPKGGDAPVEMDISKWRYDESAGLYYCTIGNPDYYKWQAFVVHVNKDNEADYVTEQNLFKGHDLKRDTGFVLYTGDLSLLHITERYNRSIVISDLTVNNSRETFSFNNLLNKAPGAELKNNIELANGIVTWKSETSKGNFAMLQLKITTSYIQETSTSHGLIFGCTATDGSGRQFELFYGKYLDLKSQSNKVDGPVMYIREMKDGMPERLQFFL